MPELPEVETIRRDLEKYVIGASFQNVKFIDFKNVAPGAAFLAKFLPGKKVTAVRRRGKLLILDFKDTDRYLLLHLKITGQLIFIAGDKKIAGGHSLSNNSLAAAVGGDLPNKFTRAFFDFDNGGRLFFNDLRKFGYIKLVDKKSLEKILADNYGPEPLDKALDYTYLQAIFKHREAPVKAVILNQKLIAGLGNIYADESLFMAGIRPNRSAKSLKKTEIEKLREAMGNIIKKAIKARGTTFRNFVDGQGQKGNFMAQLKVYQRHGQACPLCGRPLQKIKVAGRGTHYCQYCQK